MKRLDNIENGIVYTKQTTMIITTVLEAGKKKTEPFLARLPHWDIVYFTEGEQSEPEEKSFGLFKWPQTELKQIMSKWGI